jgi:hypothetical protein
VYGINIPKYNNTYVRVYLYFEVRSIAKDNIRSSKIYVAKIKA